MPGEPRFTLKARGEEVSDLGQMRGLESDNPQKVLSDYDTQLSTGIGLPPYLTFNLDSVQQVDPAFLQWLGDKAAEILRDRGRIQVVRVGEPIYEAVMAARSDGQRMFAYVPEGMEPDVIVVSPEVYTRRGEEEVDNVKVKIIENLDNWGFAARELTEKILGALRKSYDFHKALHGSYGNLMFRDGALYYELMDRRKEYGLLSTQRLLSRANPDFEGHLKYNASDIQ